MGPHSVAPIVGFKKIKSINNIEIRLRGCVFNGTTDTVVYTLPTGYRPSQEQRLATNKGAFAITTLSIPISGAMQFYSGESADHWFEGLRFNIN